MKTHRNANKPGCSHNMFFWAVNLGKSGAAISSNKVNIELLIVPKFSVKNSWFASSSGVEPTVRAITTAQMYKRKTMKRDTHVMACTAAPNPKASKYSCFRYLTKRHKRKTRMSLTVRKSVA